VDGCVCVWVGVWVWVCEKGRRVCARLQSKLYLPLQFLCDADGVPIKRYLPTTQPLVSIPYTHTPMH